MKIVKLLTVSVLLLCVLLSLSFFAAAEADWSANLTLEQTSPISADGTFNVRVFVSDITSKDGIICAIYHVYFDPTAVQLISWENSQPDNWDFSGKTSFGAEDWTDLLEDENGNPYLLYTVMNTSLEQGVKNDGVLFTDLVFKVLSDSAKTTEILVTDISFMDKNLEDDCLLSDRKLSVTIAQEESSEESSQMTPSADESSEQEESSAPDESSFAQESSEAEETSEESSAVSEDSFEASSEEDSSAEQSAAESDDSSTEASDKSEQSDVSEPEGKRVVMTVLLQDIKDEFGVSALQFKLNYKPTLLEFVDYEIILPENWDLNTEYTEDVCSVQNNGNLLFGVMNFKVGCGVKNDDVLGFRITFETKNVSFDPSLITMDNIVVINDDLKEVSQDNFHLAISYEDENGSITDDSFVSEQDKGKTIKIVIALIACIVLLAIALSAFVLIRKKKQA